MPDQGVSICESESFGDQIVLKFFLFPTFLFYSLNTQFFFFAFFTYVKKPVKERKTFGERYMFSPVIKFRKRAS